MSTTVYNRLLLVLGFAGVFVAGVLSLGTLTQRDVPCGVSHGCARVAADPSSHILGPNLPNAYVGFFVYLLLASLATYRELCGIGGSKGRFTVYLGYAIAAGGTLASMILTYISITEIKATCAWCLTSAGIMTLSLLIYMLLANKADSAPVGPPADKYGWILVPVLAVCDVAGIVVSLAMMQTLGSSRFQVTPQDLVLLAGPNAHTLNPNGVVTVVEFGDLDCPTCKHLYPQIEQAVENSRGRLRYIFHHFPLFGNPEHAGALPGAVVSEVEAEKGDFWKYLDLAYGGTESPSAPMPSADDMIKFGTKLGISETNLRKRLLDENDPARKRVMDDLDLASKYKVNQTPTFMVLAPGTDGVQVTGVRVFDILEQAPFKKLLEGK